MVSPVTPSQSLQLHEAVWCLCAMMNAGYLKGKGNDTVGNTVW